MKKLILLLAALHICTLAFTQEVGEEVCKQVNVNGEMRYTWLKVDSITEYDSNGNEIHYKDNKKQESWSNYDSQGNKIYSKICKVVEWYENDGNGNEIYHGYNDIIEYWYEYTFWENGTVKSCVVYRTL